MYLSSRIDKYTANDTHTEIPPWQLLALPCLGKPSCCRVQEKLVCGIEASQAYPVHADG